MKLINIGFGNMVSANRLVAIVSPESAPVRRLVQDARETGRVIDATYGRRTRAVIIMDSDHVVLFDDETKELCKEIVRCGGLDGRVYLALDYFDASVNRIAAWVTGFRNVQKALLNALLTPDMTAEQNAGNFTDLLVRQEELKTMPFGEIWAEYCRRCGVPEDGAWLPLVWAYEKNVLEARA